MPGFPFLEISPATKLIHRLTLKLALLTLANAGWSSLVTRKYERTKNKDYKLVGELSSDSEAFLRAVEAITGAPISYGNQVKVLTNGDQIFPAMLDAICSAEKTLNLVTFVYWKGPIAPQIAEAICEKAQEGVKCNVLLDAIGAAPIDLRLIEKMENAGVKVAWFRPPRWHNIKKLNNRTHRKILVVDGKIGFTGGVGIAEEWMGDAQDPLHWRDTHVRVEGPAVRGLQGAFCENWLEATGEVLAGEDYLPSLPTLPGDICAQVTRSSAGKGDTNIETLFFLAIASAQERLWLTTAYFVPRPALVDVLTRAAKRGVDVRVLVPGPHMNHKIARIAGRVNYSKLMKKGVRIYEYQPTMLHAKTLVVDSAWSTIGSTNFDNRSFALNDEVNISFHNRTLARALEKQFLLDLERSREFQERKWSRRALWKKILEKLSSIFSPQL
ncbi:MAG: phospholipase D/Transphosphatidylase [Chloroflexi bacterium]|jgi:cardiolipin synthase|nr:phospholipase D/Transphosphatidylase [Chloroflexota bacterium]